MRVWRDWRPLPAADRWALAVGNFDGVHCGHQALFARLSDARLRPACLTFEPHPQAVLAPPAPDRIGGAADKLRWLRDAGLQAALMLRFTRELAGLPAQVFADRLFAEIGAQRVVVGADFRFGQGRKGDVALLQQSAARLGGEVEVFELQHAQGAVISSRRIRALLAESQFEPAQTLLGRPWDMRGRVVHGQGYGRKLGFPTANLRLSFTPPCRGIFAALARREATGAVHPAALSIGTNPSVSHLNHLKIEAHLLDFDDDLYGEALTVQPLVKLHDERHYPDEAALRAGIAADVEETAGLAGMMGGSNRARHE